LLPFSSENLSSSLQSETVKIKRYKTITFPVDLYWYETLLLTSKEEYRLRGTGCRGEYFESRETKIPARRCEDDIKRNSGKN
jgi:hypothetical protein